MTVSYAPETLTLEALRSAPVPDFVERDPFKLKAWYVAEFERLTGRTLYPAQTEMFVVEVMAYAHSVFGEAAQAAFLQNRAIWATGRHLEEVGANVSTFKLPAQTATSRVRFTLSQVRPNGVVIAKGTRVSAGDSYIFSTTEEMVISAGQLTGEVDVVAASAGVGFNNFDPGQIKEILDPIAYVSTVENIIASGGGSDIEDDDRYRLRIVNAFERISKAGPREGYVEHVKAVNPAIVDVAVIRPQPGYIEITPLMLVNGVGTVSSDAVDAAILDHLDPETLIPMGDYVSIVKATGHGKDLVATLRFNGQAPDQALVDAAIRAAFAPFSARLGAQISPRPLETACMGFSGVVHAEITGLAYEDLPDTHFAFINSLVINLVSDVDD